jgi:hypothetical protein
MLLKKPSIKTLALSVGAVAIVATGVFLYNLVSNKDSTEYWYDSSWLYRSSITLSIPKDAQGEQQEVLIEVDTKALIEGGKLLENCQDLRFLDEDNETALKYWIEGGCNTNQTQVWVEIPPTSSNKRTIYQYYGNSSALDGQEEWEGEFISITQEKCKEHWRDRDIFDGRFVIGDTVYGKKGGSENHNHILFDIYQIENCPDPVNISSIEKEQICDFDKDNIVGLYSSYSSNIPEYNNVNFCGSKNGFLNNDLTLFFDDIEPEGWERVQNLDNKYFRGEDGQNPSIKAKHFHSVSCYNGDFSDPQGDTYYLSLTGLSRSNIQQDGPPSFNINLINNSEEGVIIEGGIMMATTVPPLGWTFYEEIEGYFPKISRRDFKQTSGTEDHSHFVELSSAIRTTRISRLEEIKPQVACLLEGDSGTKSFHSSVLPPFVTIPFVRKNNSTINFKYADEQSYPDLSGGEVLGSGIGPSAPTDLLTEGETNPTKVDTLTPGFTAIFNHPDYQE